MRSETADGLFDHYTYTHLMSLLGDEYFELIEDFMSHATSRVKSIRFALQSDNIEKATETATSLKAAAANLGIIRIQQSCSAIDRAIRQQHLHDALTIVSAMEFHLQQLEQHLAAQLAVET